MVQKLVVAVNVQSSTVTLLASIARVAEPKFIPLRTAPLCVTMTSLLAGT